MSKHRPAKLKASGRPGRIFVYVYTILTALPLYFVLINAFKSNKDIKRNPFIITVKTFTLEPIQRAWKLLRYPTTFANNLKLLIISTIFLVAFASMAAFAISLTRGRFLKKYYSVTIGVMTLPFTLAMVPLATIMKTLGLNNSYLGTSFVYAACTIPFAIFLYCGHIKTIPKEINEAAMLDGCSLMQTYWYIYMPLLKAATGTVVILRSVFFWNDYLIAYVTLSKVSMQPLMLTLYSFASQRLSSFDLLFAGTLLASLPIIILFVSAQKYFVGGAMAGAVKG